MTGANRKSSELRPSEFKGMMRFWWRAGRAEPDPEKLRKEEAEIFGGAGKEEGKSNVHLRILPVKIDKGRNFWEEILRNKPEEKFHGLSYLFYSALLPGMESEYIKHGSIFKILLKGEIEALRQAEAALWISLFIGSFGSRARRGAGSVTVERVFPSELALSFIPEGNNAQELSEWILENFRKAQRIISEDAPADFVSSYSNLSFSRFIISSEGVSLWKEALVELGGIYQEFRKEYQRDFLDVASFGLPIIHGHNKRNKREIIGMKGKNRIKRRASPLWFKVLYSGGKYYWMVTRLAGEFLPKGWVLKFNDRTKSPSYDLLEVFWKRLKEKGVEHVLSKPKSLERLVEELKKSSGASEIYLFGSKARGDFHENSDLDLAVKAKRPWESESLEGNINIIDLEKNSREIMGKVKREGVLLYERKG